VNDEKKPRTGTRTVLTIDIGGGVMMEFVRIPKGEFWMGAADGDKDADSDEKPVRKVEITKDFYLGKYEVTQLQYRTIMNSNPSKHEEDEGSENERRYPVSNVTWDNAVAFCERASKVTKRTMVLPSEAQWEYACRAGTTTPFHFGSKVYPHAQCAVRDASISTCAVNRYRANPWGLHAMHGNVAEWCQDYYGGYDKVAGQKDPVQLVKQKHAHRIFRGGAFLSPDELCRATSRNWALPGHAKDGMMGFRVCLQIEK
jgi:formylglycine-generating enzyme required for sulfatase activity